MKKLVISVMGLAFLAGCAALSTTTTKTVKKTNGDVETTVTNTETDFAKRVNAVAASNAQAPHAIVRITAQSGVPITGLQSVEVFAERKTEAVPVEPPSQFVQGVNAVGGVASTIAHGVVVPVVAGRTILGVAGILKEAGDKQPSINTSTSNVVTTDSSDHSVKTVGANSGANSGNSGNIADGGSAIDTSTKTDRHDTTDNHAVDNHAVDNRAVDDHSTKTTNNNAAPVVP